MSNSTVAANVTFIDLATFGELEGFLYGGPHAITWFVASVQKANWFSLIPVSLRNIGTTAQFGASKTSFSLSRQGDYAVSAFLRVKFPAIGFKSTVAPESGATIRYVDNLMHNLIRHMQIEFNDLQVQEFTNYWLDDNFEWRCVGQKRQGYLNMIGMTSNYTSPVGPGASVGGTHLSLPLPLFFGEDSGVALPVASLPFNDVKLTYDFRNWNELIIINPGVDGAVTTSDVCTYINGVPQDNQPPTLSNVETFAHYAIVHNDERVKMGDAPRDILIHQIQETQVAPFKELTAGRSSFDLRLSHAIVAFTFKAQNISLAQLYSGKYGAEWSNYTTLSSVLTPPLGVSPADPIAHTTLFYENSVRLSNASDYFSLTHPWYFSDAISENTGYHMYSYALKPWDPTRPSGSTDYSKLANVSLAHDPSNSAVQAVQGLYDNGDPITWPDPDSSFPQTFQHVFAARSWNIFRTANGSAGFPTL